MADQEFKAKLREESATLHPTLIPLYNKVADHITADKPTKINITANGTDIEATSVPLTLDEESTAAANLSTTLRVVRSVHLPRLLGIVQGTASLIHITTSGRYDESHSDHFVSLKEHRDLLCPDLTRLAVMKRTAGPPWHVATPGETYSIGVFFNTDILMFPNLTHFRLEVLSLGNLLLDLEKNILDFLQDCPQLEDAFILFGDPEECKRQQQEDAPVFLGEPEDFFSIADDLTHEAEVSLPRLRSFTHESPDHTLPAGLLNKLDLPDTCVVTLTTRGTGGIIGEPWTCGFYPALRGYPPHTRVTSVDTVTITVRAETEGIPRPQAVVGVTFLDSKRKVSLNKLVSTSFRDKPAKKEVKNILDWLKSSTVGVYFSTLNFERLPDGPAVELEQFLNKAKEIAELVRLPDAPPLKTVTLKVRDKKGPSIIRRYRPKHHDGRVEMVEESVPYR